jgi:hypothetical protein
MLSKGAMIGIGRRFVYILRSARDARHHYVGVTENPDRRLEWHNHGPCGHTTGHQPWTPTVRLLFASASLMAVASLSPTRQPQAVTCPRIGEAARPALVYLEGAPEEAHLRIAHLERGQLRRHSVMSAAYLEVAQLDNTTFLTSWPAIRWTSAVSIAAGYHRDHLGASPAAQRSARGGVFRQSQRAQPLRQRGVRGVGRDVRDGIAAPDWGQPRSSSLSRELSSRSAIRRSRAPPSRRASTSARS